MTDIHIPIPIYCGGNPGRSIAYGRSHDHPVKKGILETCFLSVLAYKDCYGYELVGKNLQWIDISERTIYPLLRRLKDEGYVITYLQESVEGPSRKDYRLTETGRKEEQT